MYITVQQAAEKWGISERRVRTLCSANKIPGAYQEGRSWKIPADAEKPADGRYRAESSEEEAVNRKQKKEKTEKQVEEEKGDGEDKRVKQRVLILSKIVVSLAMILVGTIIVGFILNTVQTRASLNKQKDNNRLALSEVVSILDKNKGYSDTLAKTYHEGNIQLLEDMKVIFTNGLFDKMVSEDSTIQSQIFDELASSAGVSYLYLLSTDGHIVMSTLKDLVGRNPATTEHMTQENLNKILENAGDQGANADPVLVKNQHGTFYFYSDLYSHQGVSYVVTMGVDSQVLDDSTGNLEDVSTVLSRMGVINDGFLFAVSKKDNLFVYYKNGDDFLTGQNAFMTGLTERILEDGYTGKQTILGEQYYCSSKTLDDNTVIVAAARSKTVLEHDSYVLVWSVVGFLLVLLLCLAYSIIVQNDFLRQGIKTETSTLLKRSAHPLYFNKSVFRKVFPLMMLGILAVYGISFYSQTLLEITEGVDKSNVILQEVNGRYEESLHSRQVIEAYNNARFLSTARIIRFYVEENPEALNAPSAFYHSYFDENNIRQYLSDDEGNPLKSVANSAILQKLCDSNHIDAIYLFDENGRTIATSTGNWFFILSTVETDQSYPFREVLDGKLDSYLQSVMTDDLGDTSQYCGISFNYYTKQDTDGNTVYVSRYEFEEACDAAGVTSVRTCAGITKHNALLQIELDEDLISSTMGSTTAEAVLSTEMLTGGAIIMFDTSRDHVCVYSPARASIGRTAEELGVSSKAFSGNEYYGFSRVNGKMYFTLFRYIENNFIATAIPQSSMFVTRSTISFITAGICLLVIAALLMLVTMYGEEEAELYRELVEGYSDDNLNSPIFAIILPSGRFASTTKAQVRWDNRYIKWNERSPEMKFGIILGWIVSTVVLVFFFMALRINNNGGSDSIIRYIFSGNWDRSPNIFALTACILVVIVSIIGIELIKIPVRLCTSFLGTRGETIGHLLLSVAKYGGAIGALFYCLYLLGIDSVNLLASAGIISLVIGLGAQSLIKDIISGIFIVFEGEFRVGDIVTINDFRGTVTDIGLRTTKISAGGNIKIFNNSDISGVMNMTKETSVASAGVGLEYGQDNEYIEEVMARELPLLSNFNKILDGPTSLGITELAERRYVYTVMARCSEQNVMDVNRYLNKALLQICLKNGIKVANQGKDTFARIASTDDSGTTN